MGIAPIVGVPAIGDGFTNAHRIKHIGTRADERRQAAFFKVQTIRLVMRFGQDRQAAHILRQVAGGDVCFEGELHLMGAHRLDAFNLCGKDRAEIGQPLGQKHLVGKDHIFRSQGRAIGKSHIIAQVEDHPRPVLGVFDRLTEQAIGGSDLVAGAFKDRFERGRGKGRRPALDRIGVHAVEPARSPFRNLAALGGVRVDVIQMRKPRRIFQLAKGRDAMGDDHAFRLGRIGRKPRHKQGKPDGSPCRPGDPVCPCPPLCNRLRPSLHPSPPALYRKIKGRPIRRLPFSKVSAHRLMRNRAKAQVAFVLSGVKQMKRPPEMGRPCRNACFLAQFCVASHAIRSARSVGLGRPAKLIFVPGM